MEAFQRLKVATRLYILVFITLVGLLALSASSLYQLKSTMLEDRKGKIENLVELALGIAERNQALAAAGKLTEEEAKEATKDTLRKLRYSKTEYFFSFDKNGVYVFHGAKAELEGQNQIDQKDANGKLIVRAMLAVAAQGGGFVDYWFPKAGQTKQEPKLSYTAMFEPWGWAIGTGIYIDDVDREFKRSVTILGGISLALLCLLVALGWMVASSIVNQLGGEPTAASAVMHKIADGDLTADVGQPRSGSLLDTLRLMVGSLRELVTEIDKGADQVVDSAERINTASKEVATAAELQADATASIAAAIEELTVTSNHISDSAKDTKLDSEAALNHSTEGSARVEQATTAMQNISTTVVDAASRIHALEKRTTEVTSIANVIKDIAGQTNLLALNAAIEAARAGEQGRGFAVVADEVRKLAERTATATNEIEEMIGGIQSETVGAVGAMEAALPQVEHGVELGISASESLKSIESGSKRNLDRIGEVADATREQSSASTSIAQRVEQIAQMVDETSATIRSTADTAASLEEIAQGLKRQVRRFKV
ncbi:MAG: methyl-accepting chemotaxis protein [Rhodocyclaceae bacterium]|nr:methyl-accepting chemotaxis protein [Rhodocyclaceae bacterium]